MIETGIAKLFENGQAVHLPTGFRFDGEEIYATRDGETGDVVLSNQPDARTWKKFFELLHSVKAPSDFMSERPLNVLPVSRNLFDDEIGQR